jgi:hypothetical protein
MSKEFYWTKMSSKTNFANTIREGDGEGTLITSEVAVNRLNFLRTRLTETSKLLHERNAEVARLKGEVEGLTRDLRKVGGLVKLAMNGNLEEVSTALMYLTHLALPYEQKPMYSLDEGGESCCEDPSCVTAKIYEGEK